MPSVQVATDDHAAPTAAGPARPGRRRLLRSERAWVTCLLVAPLVAFVTPALVGHPILLGDDLTQNEPLRILVGADLRHGHLPLFDPYLWSGAPLLAGWNAGAAYPLTWLFAVLPATAAWTVGLVVTWWVAGLSFYGLLRSHRLVPVAAGLGALSFVFGGAFLAQIVHFGLVAGMSWVPLQLLAVHRLTAGGRPRAPARWAAVFAGALGGTVLAGEPRAIVETEVVGVVVALWLGLHPLRLRRARMPGRRHLATGARRAAAAHHGAGSRGEPVPGIAAAPVPAPAGPHAGTAGAVPHAPPHAPTGSHISGGTGHRGADGHVPHGLPAGSLRRDIGARARFFGYAALGGAWGVALAAVQLVPGWAFIRASQRAVESYHFFGAGSLRPTWSVLLLVPDLFGGSGHLGQPHYFTTYNLAEVTGYVGLLPVGAALVLLSRSVGRRRSRRAADWGVCLALGGLVLLLAWGTFTPLGHLFAAVPLLGKTRLQSRNLEILDLALAVLLAFFVDRALDARPPARAGARGRALAAAPAAAAAAVCVAALVAPGAVVGWLAGHPVEGSAVRDLWPWLAAEGALAAGVVALFWRWRHLGGAGRPRAIAALVVADLALFALIFFHALNGVRLLLLDLGWLIGRQRTLFWTAVGMGVGALALSAALLVPAAGL